MIDEHESKTRLSLQENASSSTSRLDQESKNLEYHPQASSRGTPQQLDKQAAGKTAGAAPRGDLLSDEFGQIEVCDPDIASLLHTTSQRLKGRMLISMIPADLHQEFFDRLAQIRSTRQSTQWQTKLILADSSSFLAQLEVIYLAGEKNSSPSFRWRIQEVADPDQAGSDNPQVNPQQPQEFRSQINGWQSAYQNLLNEIELLKQERLDLIQARDSLDSRLRSKTAQLDRLHVQLLAEIARREGAEQASAQLTRQLRELHSAAQASLSTLDLEPLIGRILDAASQAIPSCERGMLYLIAKNTGELEMRAMFGYSDPRIRTIPSQKSNNYVAKAVQERSPLMVDDIQAAVTEGETSPDAPPVRSALIAPLILEGESFGALCLESSLPRAFNDSDLQLLNSFAATATAAIRNAMLHAEVQNLALTDSLTNLLNRRGFNEFARRELERARRFGRPLSAVMIDMDHFKEINDRHGHAEGDKVLRKVADLIKHSIREVDILGRYGGDEFDILLPETDLFVACNVAERLRQCIEGLEINFDHQTIHVSASLGVAKYSPDIIDLDTLVSRADAAMYTAKQSGRNRIEIG